jgi:hypothetical protein
MDGDSEASEAGGTLSRRGFLAGALAVSGLVVLEAGATSEAADSARYLDPPGTIEAGFLKRSYAPGATAELVVQTEARGLALQLMRAGLEPTKAHTGMGGVPVGPPRTVRWHGGRGALHISVDALPSGLHFVYLQDRHGQTGYAPFVVRPAKLGAARTLVVHPTNTWGAYNLRYGATWYANVDVQHVDLTRPFLGGPPPHYRDYDMGFMRWLAHSGHRVDVISDDDLEAMPSGEELRRLYDLIVFSGHEEYVTEHTFDNVERYQALGGNLIFLSANNFFYKVEKQGDTMHGRWRWRDLGRPEARMIGSQYLNWYQGRYKNMPLTVTGAEHAPWLFEGTGLANGSSFGTYGIEVDALDPASPPGVQVLAEAKNIFGPGQTGQMTHYKARNGAEVFDAGVLNFSGTADNPGVSRMVENLWRRLGPPVA